MEVHLREKTETFEREKAELKRQIEDHLDFMSKLNQQASDTTNFNSQLKSDLQEKEAQVIKL